jgi:maltooligosyltrehalose trehalohydrolase
VDFESLKLAAGATLLSPFLPLLFMGEEYGETAPFPYFTSHGDAALIEAVRSGRRDEFAAFSWKGELPDPQDEETFLRARLTPGHSWSEFQRVLCDFYRELIRLRKKTPALAHLSMEQCQAASWGEQTLFVRRWHGENEVVMLLNFSGSETDLTVPLELGEWTKLLDSAETRWNGPGSTPPRLPPRSIVVYEKVG